MTRSNWMKFRLQYQRNPKENFVFRFFKFIILFFLIYIYRFDSKESATDNHKARQTDTRYYLVNEITL